MYYNCVTSCESKLSQEELLSKVQAHAFAINDLA